VWNPATLSGSRFVLPVVGAGSALATPLAAVAITPLFPRQSAVARFFSHSASGITAVS
jgi:hypothetical protein